MYSFSVTLQNIPFQKCENVFMCKILEPQALTLYFRVGGNEIDVSYSCKMPKISRTEMN